MRLAVVLASLLLLLSGCAGMADDLDQEIPGVQRLSISITPDGSTLSYLSASDAGGVRRRLVMVHGTPGSAGAFRGFLRDPPSGMEVLAVDRPGFGQSGPPGAVVSFAEQAGALAGLLESVDGRKPILLGHSLGGPIVARAAADFPDRVGAIVILAGSLDPRFERVGLLQGLATSPPVRSLLPRSLRNTLLELRAGRAQTEALAGVLARVRCPVLIIHGTKDGLVPYENVPYMQRAFTGASPIEVVTITGGDHFLPWNRAREVREAIARLDAEGVSSGW